MTLQVVLLIIGFIILIKGADIFVDGSSSVARNFNISTMLIGLTIVSFGTSAPELAVSIKALIGNNGDIVLGNVLGSNILNVLLILGISSIIRPLKVRNSTVRKELPITLLLSSLLIILFIDNLFDKTAINQISRSDGLVLLLFFTVFIYYLFSIVRNKSNDQKEPAAYNIPKSILLTILGLIGIVIGSTLVVDGASFIANYLGVSQRMISLTIVALGTSLPELVTSVMAAKKGELDIAIGNIVGSNIFNLGVVLGMPVALFGSVIPTSFSYLDLIMLLISTIMLFMFSYTKRTISKNEGIIMLITFVIYYSIVIIK
ncbi:MAG: calcium/sodium antiporter [Bacilli bacterium]